MSRRAVWFIRVMLLMVAMAMPLMAADKIDLNTATVEQLATLDQIGPVKAAAIIEYRKANGPFTAPEDLMKVNGIGEKIFSLNKDRVMVSAPSSGAAPKASEVTPTTKPAVVPASPALPAVPATPAKKQ